MRSLKKYLKYFDKAKVLVIGDLILDQYIWGDVDRISPEAPVPVVWAKRRGYVPGGAANVANNISSLGGKAFLCGVVGADAEAKRMTDELRVRKIDTRGIFSEKERHTTLKTRVLAGHQQVVRVDWENRSNVKKETRERILGYIDRSLRNFDAVIVEDYGKGLLDREMVKYIIGKANGLGKIITVDPKEDNFDCYFGASCITPNRKETQNAIRYLKMKDTGNRFKVYSEELKSHQDIVRSGNAILEHLELESLLITLGEDGMWLFEKDRNEHIPTVAQEVFDVSGAGDTVISTFTMALACGAPKLEAAHLANFAAGIVVSKLGTAVTNRKELSERLG